MDYRARGSAIMLGLFSFIFSVANGEPPIGIPWETFRKYAKITRCIMKEMNYIIGNRERRGSLTRSWQRLRQIGDMIYGLTTNNPLNNYINNVSVQVVP